LFLSAVIVVSWIRRRRRPDVATPSEGTVWVLGTILIICGFSQLGQALVPARWAGGAGPPLLAAVACWAAVLAMRSSGTRAPAPEGTAAAAVAQQKVPEDADRGRLEQALRHAEAQVRLLTESDARKNQFLAALGHELRNPLAPIRNALRIMKRTGLDDPELCWARDVVEHQLHQLGQLVDDLQEISRVTIGKVRLQKEPVDVATILHFAVETSRPIIDAHHHRLTIALPPQPVLVEADPIRMAQVLSNLLNNAAKYTPDGGQIRLGATIENSGSEAVFRVRDNGIGIAPEMLARIFDLFAQAEDALDRAQGGLDWD
jgi:signal transduction histidine kinase